MEPDIYPAGTVVLFEWDLAEGEPIPLGPNSTKMFLDMLAQPSVHSHISSMTAAPIAYFHIGYTVYAMHGNAVTRGRGPEERLWHGPFLQRLITDAMNQSDDSRAALVKVLNTIEQDPDVAKTSLEGPGAYPGGGPAIP